MTSGEGAVRCGGGALIPLVNKGDQGTKNYNSKEVLFKSIKRAINPCNSATYAVDSAPDRRRVS
jgi:hypothetical protein